MAQISTIWFRLLSFTISLLNLLSESSNLVAWPPDPDFHNLVRLCRPTIFLINPLLRIFKFGCLASCPRFPQSGQGFQTYHFLIESLTRMITSGCLASWSSFPQSSQALFLIKSFIKTINLACLASRSRFPGFGKGFQSYDFRIKSFTEITILECLALTLGC